MKENPKLDFYRNWIALFIIGSINNLPYVVVNSSAKVLATSFGQENFVTMVMLSNVCFGFFAKGTNTILSLTTFPVGIKFFINGCLMLIGLVGVAFAPNFWIALTAIVFAGCSSAFGESFTLGFLHNHPKEMINAWSSGTGFAGVLGAALYIMLSCIAENTVIGKSGNFDPKSSFYTSELKTINKFVFLGTIPVVLLYWFAYYVLVKTRKPTTPVVNGDDDDTKPLLNGNKLSVQNDSVSNESVATEPTLIRVWRCIKITFWLSLNLLLVYFFEYTCRSFAAKARPPYEYYVSELHCPELYASIQLCYQAGVFVSRSSVQTFQIRRVEIFTVLQFINMILWIAQAWWKFLPVYLLPVFMVYVGLLGGASYVNIFYMLRTGSKYPERDKELCINVVSMYITFGILSGASFPLVLFKTLFKDK